MISDLSSPVSAITNSDLSLHLVAFNEAESLIGVSAKNQVAMNPENTGSSSQGFFRRSLREG